MNIKKLVAEYGAINLRIFIPMQRIHLLHGLFGIPMGFTSSNDPWDIVECVIDESRYKVSDGYKITFKALDESYGSDHYYQMDFDNMFRKDRNHGDYRVYILVDEDNKYELIREN